LSWYVELSILEEASKYHASLIKDEIAGLHKGLEKVLDHLEHSAEEYKTGSYAEYAQLMDEFVDHGFIQYDHLVAEWNSFEPEMTKVMKTFPTDGPLQDIFKTIHLFAKKFKDITDQKRLAEEELDRFERLGWLGDVNPNPEPEIDLEPVKAPKKQGILDQLVEGIVRGDYGLSEDSTSQFAYLDPIINKPTNTSNTSQNPTGIVDDQGFGSRYADDLLSFGGDENQQMGEAIDDIDDILSGIDQISGFTIDQLIG